MNPLAFLCGSLIGLSSGLLVITVAAVVFCFKALRERDMTTNKLEDLGYALYLQYQLDSNLPLFKDLTSVMGDPPNSRRFAVVAYPDTSSSRRIKFMVDGTRVVVCN